MASLQASVASSAELAPLRWRRSVHTFRRVASARRRLHASAGRACIGGGMAVATTSTLHPRLHASLLTHLKPYLVLLYWSTPSY